MKTNNKEIMMSLEKVANGLGSLIKIFVYGFILLVIAVTFIIFGYARDKPTVSKKAEVISQQETKPSIKTSEIKKEVEKTETQPVVATTEQVNDNVPADTLESKIKVEVIKITPENYNDISKSYSGIGLKIKVANESEKIINGFMGSLVIYDAFGDRAGSFLLKEDETIKPGATKILDLSYKINLFDNKDQNITQLKKWTSSFKAEKILVD